MYEILELTNSDDSLYRLVGPLMGSRKVAKEIGINIYADDDKVFYVVLGVNGLLGMLSIRGTVISDCYVVPECRRRGIFTALLAHVVIHGREYRAACTEMSRGAFEKAGFKAVRQTKNFTFMELKNA